MNKLDKLSADLKRKNEAIADEAKRTRNDNTAIEVDRRLREAKAEFELLKPYIKTIRRKKSWDEMQKELRKGKSG